MLLPGRGQGWEQLRSRDFFVSRIGSGLDRGHTASGRIVETKA
jgi:hypothetical protein